MLVDKQFPHHTAEKEQRQMYQDVQQRIEDEKTGVSSMSASLSSLARLGSSDSDSIAEVSLRDEEEAGTKRREKGKDGTKEEEEEEEDEKEKEGCDKEAKEEVAQEEAADAHINWSHMKGEYASM